MKITTILIPGFYEDEFQPTPYLVGADTVKDFLNFTITKQIKEIIKHCTEAARIHGQLLKSGDCTRTDIAYELDRLCILITSMLSDLVYLINTFQSGYSACGYSDTMLINVKNYKSMF